MREGYASRLAEPKSEAISRFWIPPGQAVTIAGREIPGGMLLIGNGLRSVSGSMVDPAPIDPSLRVEVGRGAISGEGMTYWPSYSGISPSNRAAYLDWLAGGRSAPNAYIGYVFLYFYGLERRVLDPWTPCPEAERRAIANEVKRLLAIYRSSGSFQNYAGAFLEVVLAPLLDGEPAGHSPAELGSGGLRAALSDCATRQRPIPAELAYQWVISSPTARLTTPAHRCRADFHRLFVRRYEARFGAGIKVKGRGGRAQATYQPASAGFAGAVRVSYPPDRTPRVVSDDIPSRLQELVDSCTSDLEAYSRWIGKNPGKEKSIAAVALLPEELLDSERRSTAAPFLGLLETALANEPCAVLAGDSVLRVWPTGADGKLGKGDYVGLAQVLEKFGYGLEPDVRFGGPKFGPADRIVVFKQSEEPSAVPSPEYAGTTLLLHLAALVATADGTVTPGEETHLATHLERVMSLSGAERARLQAHLRWLVTSQPGFNGIRKRITSLNENQRQALGEFLVSVAGADGAIANTEIETLQKIYRMIGLPPTLVFSHVHALSTDASSQDGPVTVIPSAKRDTDFRIPAATAAAPGTPATVRLNAALIEKKLQQTSAVAALLGSVFTTDDETPTEAVSVVTPREPSIAGLDPAHSKLLLRLVGMTTCPRPEFEAMAASFHLLPDGALDRLNEASYEAVGAPLIDDGDPLTIDATILQELAK